MASEPTDLIREADEVHKPVRPRFFDEGKLVCEDCGDLWPCEVRRLRDALDASETEVAEAWEQANRMDDASATVIRMMARDWQKTEDERDEARAALAEANATIQRVKALAFSSDDGSRWEDIPEHEDCGGSSDCPGCWAQSIRRAIEGPQS